MEQTILNAICLIPGTSMTLEHKDGKTHIMAKYTADTQSSSTSCASVAQCFEWFAKCQVGSKPGLDVVTCFPNKMRIAPAILNATTTVFFKIYIYINNYIMLIRRHT